jgi:hypothetical protein
MVVIAGATAVGGGDFTVVVLFEVVSDVDLLVESVTIGSTAHAIVEDKVMTKSTALAMFLIISFPFGIYFVIIVIIWKRLT